MADEVQYDSSTKKRQYADAFTTPLSTGRVSDFSSSPIASQSPDPPSGGEAKRRRFENRNDYEENKSFGSGFSSAFNGQKPLSSVASVPASYGDGANSKKNEIPNNRVAVIIGKGGETITLLRIQSRPQIQVTRDTEADPNSPTSGVELTGTPKQIAKAEQLINDVFRVDESRGSAVPSCRTGQQGDDEHFIMMIPNNKVGLVIGKSGETIKKMQIKSGARIQVMPLHPPPGDYSAEGTLQMYGTSDQIEAAKNCLRNPGATRYFHQGHQSRPPAYGYVHPGRYAGETPQYNMAQPQYPYPSQPTSGGYDTGWDHSAAATNQQTTQVGGYDYYSQQPALPQQAPGSSGSADMAGYAYSQQAVSGYNQQGQSYAQDGYGGYHHASAPQTGYGQAQPVYDQQQGYNTTPGYYNVATSTPDWQTPSYGAQGDGSQAPPSSALRHQGYSTQQPSPDYAYPPQLPTQPGYVVPPTSKTGYGSQPPSGYAPSYEAFQTQKPTATQQAYGQKQQSPTAQGGYVQPAQVQPGYQPPPSQAGYAQPDSGAQRVAASGYSAAQASSYAPAPYCAPPVTWSAYGQTPPLYNSSYGNAYSQPAAYSVWGCQNVDAELIG